MFSVVLLIRKHCIHLQVFIFPLRHNLSNNKDKRFNHNNYDSLSDQCLFIL